VGRVPSVSRAPVSKRRTEANEAQKKEAPKASAKDPHSISAERSCWRARAWTGVDRDYSLADQDGCSGQSAQHNIVAFQCNAQWLKRSLLYLAVKVPGNFCSHVPQCTVALGLQRDTLSHSPSSRARSAVRYQHDALSSLDLDWSRWSEK